MDRILRISVLCSALFAAGLSAVGCRELANPFEGEQVLARAGKETLHRMDVEKVFPSGITGADSISWVENYVDRWVRDHLKLQEAKRLFGENTEDEELVEAYRNSLAMRHLEQHFIGTVAGDSLYTDGELRDYYEQHRGDFVLDRSIVKGRVVSFPTAFRQKTRLKQLFASWTNDGREEVLAMASKNGFTVQEVPEWTEYPRFLGLLPTRRNDSYDGLLSRQGIQEMTDGATTYWFVVSEARTAGQTKPYEMVVEMVRGAVATRRKAEIIKACEDSLYRQALLEKKAIVNMDYE